MVTIPHSGAAQIFRDYINDGVSASGKWRPRKLQVREWGAAIERGLWGSAFALDPSWTDFDSIIEPGKYTVGLTDLLNQPEAVVGMLEVERRSLGPSRLTQTYTTSYINSDNAVRTWRRNYQEPSGWSRWVLNYTQSSVLGVVAQSGGVPTGALIESFGAPGDGGLRFADGTQIHWRTFSSIGPISTPLGAAFQSAEISITGWLKNFSARPVVSLNAYKVNSAAHVTACQMDRATSSSGGTFILTRYVSTTSTDFGCDVLAVGRWF